MATTKTIRLPLRTVSVLNTREHHMARHRRAKKHREMALPSSRAPRGIELFTEEELDALERRTA